LKKRSGEKLAAPVAQERPWSPNLAAEIIAYGMERLCPQGCIADENSRFRARDYYQQKQA